MAIADALQSPLVDNMYVIDVLAYQHRWAVTRAERAIRGICSPHRLVSELTERQRDLLVEVAAGRLEFDPPTSEHVAPAEAAERRAVRSALNTTGRSAA